MKLSRWFVLCSTLTLIALLPGLPALDAQFGARGGCGGHWQLNTVTVRWQMQQPFHQQHMMMQQMNMQRMQIQQHQMRLQMQQATIHAHKQQMAMTQQRLQVHQATIHRPVAAQIGLNKHVVMAGARKITTMPAVIHHPGGRGVIPLAPKTTITNYRHVLGITSQHTKIASVPSTLSKITYHQHTITGQKKVIAANTGHTTITGVARKVQTSQAKITSQAMKITSGMKTVYGTKTINIWTWVPDPQSNMVAKGRPQTNPPPHLLGQRPPAPHLIAKQGPPMPHLFGKPAMPRLQEPLPRMGRPQPPLIAKTIPTQTGIRTGKPPVRDMITGIVRPTTTPVQNLFLPPGRPVTSLWTGPTGTVMPSVPGTQLGLPTAIGGGCCCMPGMKKDLMQSMGYAPIASSPGTTTSTQPLEGSTTPTTPSLPVEALKIPMPPQTSEMIRQTSPIARLHAALTDAPIEGAPQELVTLQPTWPALSDADLQVPSLPALPGSILVLTGDAEDAQEDAAPLPGQGDTTQLVQLVPSAPSVGLEQTAPARTTPRSGAPVSAAASRQSLTRPSLPSAGRDPS